MHHLQWQDYAPTRVIGFSPLRESPLPCANEAGMADDERQADRDLPKATMEELRLRSGSRPRTVWLTQFARNWEENWGNWGETGVRWAMLFGADGVCAYTLARR